MSGAPAVPADAAADAVLSPPEILADAYLTYEHYKVSLTHADGSRAVLQRDVVRVGAVVGILCLDLARDCIVLIRQFRLAAHLATGRGQMVELPAGRVDPGEDRAEAARRECVEETGLTPLRLFPMFELMSTPGVIDEHCALFLALVDASTLPARAGLATESEVTVPFAVPVDVALRLLDEGGCVNGYLLLALQWLALNRARIDFTG
ncbi:NUDIX domain-containing protein [Aquabacter spiritensis]|uniref:GDP-mannose pyrophosphatase n=1 Tax=Aquabacter spiritensis TaxID=933073 RepID=A0A4R3M597_9HYPH|nr:NUDIX hydrolase [Aquabacter spiritensis]TCT06607.1 ADP-ribose pyrophosphatase [Aquabacter spiritensis]